MGWRVTLGRLLVEAVFLEGRKNQPSDLLLVLLRQREPLRKVFHMSRKSGKAEWRVDNVSLVAYNFVGIFVTSIPHPQVKINSGV